MLFQRIVAGFHNGLIAATAALVAYGPAHALGLREGFWAALTTFALVQIDFGRARAMAPKQLAGALIGGIVGLGLLLAFGQSLWAYFAGIAISTLACWALNLAAGSPVAGMTCTVIMVVPPALGTPQHMLIARVVDVAWGICVAVFVVWLDSHLPASWRPRIGDK